MSFHDLQAHFCLVLIIFLCLNVPNLRAEGHHSCFQVLTIMNKAAINICIQVFVWTYALISIGYIPGSGIAGPHSTYCCDLFKMFSLSFSLEVL